MNKIAHLSDLMPKVIDFLTLQSEEPDRAAQYFLTDNLYYEGGNNVAIDK